MNRIFPIVLVSLALSGCGTAAQPADVLLAITDLLGRPVSVPADVTRVIAIGPGALRLYVYAGNLDFVVGVEQMDTGDVSGKPYMLANPMLAQLPVIGLGGPNNAPDPEKILAVEPQVIFSTYALDAETADELQAQTGIPVVVLSYGAQGFGTTSIFGQPVQDSLRLIGRIIGQTSKSESAIAFLLQSRRDLGDRTQAIPDAEKPTVYIGGLGSLGLHGIESTQGHYALLDAVHAKNVVDETGRSGSVMIDKEQLLEWDPDFVFIDLGGYATVREDYRKNSAFYDSLSAVRSGQVFSQLPYNYYSTNLDTAIADAYYLGKILYPEAFADVDPAVKADEIYRALLGQPVYARMSEDFGGFRKLPLGD
ncbi:MAG: iron ABC transporter substrate-binding protein [Anaerolineales bacterium]|nr:iron ABC transporter substrate-binding protein [Anaerolineales bacterium]